MAKTCTKCGRDLCLTEFYTTGKKVDGTPKYNSWCKVCIKVKMASYHEKTWGPKKLSFSAAKRTHSIKSYLSYLHNKAKARRDCKISLNDLVELWEQQKGLCALTGWEMTKILGQGVIATNASIDRVNSSQPYTKDNVQLVCRAANVAKSDLTQQHFIRLCLSVVEKHYGKIQD